MSDEPDPDGAIPEVEEGADPNVNDEQGQEQQEDEEDIGFGDEDDDDSAPDLPKRLRAEIKSRDRELAQAKKQLAELQKPAPKTDPGPRPTREQFDWDDDAYDKAIDEWNEQRLRAEAEASAPNELQAEAQQDVQRLTTGISALTFADAQEIVPATMEALTPDQQFVFASASKDPAKLIYALGKNPARLKALLDIKNPVKFIAEVARMETQMTTKTRTPPAPEVHRQGDASAAASVDKEEARLEKEAQRTGNRTALINYRRQKKAA